MITLLIFAGVAYSAVTSFVFLTGQHGSFLMYRAAQLGLVPQSYAERHLADIVLFRQVAAGEWEYRYGPPLLGYANIPGVTSHRTPQDLLSLCNTRDPNGNYGCKVEDEY